MRSVHSLPALAVVGFAVGACSILNDTGRGVPGARVEGEVWVGSIHAGGGLPIRVTRGSPTGQNRGTIEYLGGAGARSYPLSSSDWAGGKIRLAWTDERGAATLEGALGAGGISGTFRQGQTSGAAFLTRGARVDSAAFARLFGLYEFEPGHLVWVGPVRELSFAPGYVDARTGRTGLLFPLTGTRFFSGSTSMTPFPAGLHFDISALDSGAPGNLLWWGAASSHAGARRLDTYSTQQVSFTSGGATLSGTLVSPKSPGPHPAVVLFHDAAGQTRATFSALPYLLANAGVAALIYDQRGVGRSSGTLRSAGSTDLADDGLAAVRFLRRRTDIASGRVGVYGRGEGGLHAQVAAVRSGGDATFAVLASPTPPRSAATPRVQPESTELANLMARLTIPVLVLYAENDERVKGRETVRATEAVFRQARNRDFTVRVLPRANQDFWTTRPATATDLEGMTGYVPSFFPTVIDWIVARTRPASRPAA